MRRLRSFLIRLADLFNRARRDRDLAAELDSHLQLHIDDNLRAGMTLSEARRQRAPDARRRRADQGTVPRPPWASRAWARSDRTSATGHASCARIPASPPRPWRRWRWGLARIRRSSPSSTRCSFGRCPYPDSDRLVSAVQLHAKSGPEWATWPDYTDWRDQTTRLQGLGGAWQATYNLTGVDEPERLSGAAVTASLFPVLGVSPVAWARVQPERRRESPERRVGSRCLAAPLRSRPATSSGARWISTADRTP